MQSNRPKWGQIRRPLGRSVRTLQGGGLPPPLSPPSAGNLSGHLSGYLSGRRLEKMTSKSRTLTTFPTRACKNLVPCHRSAQGSIWSYLKSWGLGFEVLKQKARTLQNYHPGGYQALHFGSRKHIPYDILTLNLMRLRCLKTKTWT